jgi:prevent-host-death family protein
MRKRFVGIKELKAKATQIVREVREEGAEYVITHRGAPAALLVPLADDSPADPAKIARLFDDIDALAESIAKRWPERASSEQILSRDRRDP